MSQRIIDTVAGCPGLPSWELAVQSGDDEVLRRMARGYTRSASTTWCAVSARPRPMAAINTDIIVGFPGERAALERTDAGWQETRFDLGCM